tara:strand:- start:185 stop:340 length:156 start_codon:yes stop_codon:yes gene_type:complete
LIDPVRSLPAYQLDSCIPTRLRLKQELELTPVNELPHEFSQMVFDKAGERW